MPRLLPKDMKKIKTNECHRTTIFVTSQRQFVSALRKIGLAEAKIWLNSEIDSLRDACEKLGINWNDLVK